jgi:outer membrane usher protein
VDASHAERSGGSGSASLNYLAPFAQLGAGVSAGERYQQVNVSASGSLLAHGGGIALGQTLGETLGLVHVADTPGVGLGNAPGTRTDSRGYALIPYLTPYRKNRVSLDTSGLDHSTEIENGVTNVVPRRGRWSRPSSPRSGWRRCCSTCAWRTVGCRRSAPRWWTERSAVGVVGPGGQALLAFEGDVGALTVRWGANASQQCRALLALAGEAPAQGYRQVQSVCRQGEVALVSITPQVADEERDSGTE